MIKTRFYLLAGMLALAGCDSGLSAEQQARLNSFVGKTELDVVRGFGVPTRAFQSNGHLFLAYIDNEIYYSPGTAYSGWGWGDGPGWGWGGPGWGWGGGPGWGWGGGSPPTVYNTTCQTTFELADGKVTGWTVRGNGC